MRIELPKETQDRLLVSLKRYAAQNLDEEFGDLKAKLLLDFCLKEIGPSVYNLAVGHAQAFMQDKVVDMDGALYQREFAFWED
jgi:uncharacterized protein (DUF2164 family)